MAKVRVTNSSGSSQRNIRPCMTPESEEEQCIALAISLVKQRMLDGTASSQETTHFLKQATAKSRLEKEILEKQKDLITAKTEALQSAKRIEELYTNALNAMRNYSGQGEPDDY